MSGLGTGRISRMPPQENVRGSQANVRISNTKEDEAKGDLGLGPGRISQMPPQEKVRGSQANVRIANTKEDEAKGDLGLGTGRISQKSPRISGKCPDLKYQRG